MKKVKLLLLSFLLSGCTINFVNSNSNSSLEHTLTSTNDDNLSNSSTSSSISDSSISSSTSSSSIISSSNLSNLSSTSTNIGSSNSSTSSSIASTSSNSSPSIVLNQGLTGREYLDYYGYATGCLSMPSTGSPNMLVVPIMFKGDSLNNQNDVLNDIKYTFNGSSDETSWESVDSYYKKTSYGKLDMDIEVYNKWITLDKTCSQLASLTNYADPTWYAVNYVVNYLKNEGIDLTNYDSNSDGYIDGIWLVYGRNYSSASTSEEENILWAYTYWMYENTPNLNNPTANVYAWASIEFMYEGGYEKPDAHTFIHETGHMLGLNDYYDYDDNTTLSPTGCLDMMDYNIGDHNAYSKYLLDWVNPTYVTNDSTISLEPFENSGECIIVPTNLLDDKSPLNEYLIIEFYTPTGLNESDSLSNYSGTYPLLFTENGVKVYHVDSRLGEFIYDYGDWYFDDYINNYSYEELISNTGYYNYFDLFNSNTSSNSYNENYKLLTLLSSDQKSNKTYFYSNTYAKNKDLYNEGDIINSFNFNNGDSLMFNISIENITSSSATIKFTSK